ncbi:hypothetical protein G9A89_014442 [Geosiphon pyriformis]|nr:hypothetical protein G9A89_014442 [Geosiphon pyriformis]
MDKTTIESLSIIQRTPSKLSDTTLAEHHQWKTSTDNTKPKVAESEIIGTNHLGFAKFLFQQYSQQLGLNNNHYPAESAFNFYVNEKITDFLGRPVDIESARENFYSELIQHTNLPRNHSFAPIIREINQKIEKYTQRTFPIIIKFLIYSSYHHMPRSTINIISVNTSTSTKMPLARIDFNHHLISQILEPSVPEKLLNQKKKKTRIRNLITKTQNQNSKLSHQQNLPPVIVIDQPPIKPISEPIQPLQVPPQQLLLLQQLQQQPPQLLNLDPMVYAPIAKLDNFTSKEDNSLINKPQDFNVFKVEFLRYFSNNNSINCLVNTFTTMKQGEMEAVTTYLECFHQNLHQIQAIDANYFTAPQILNQFIRGLHSSILQYVYLLHPGTLQDTVICTRDFESAESETNHAQAINLVMDHLNWIPNWRSSVNQLIRDWKDT